MKVTKLLSLCAVAHRYMLISSPEQGQVFYARLNTAAEEARRRPLKAESLFTCGTPKGISVDQAQSILYVADTGTNSIVSTELTVMGDATLSAGAKVDVVAGADASWVSVDSQGNVFYSRSTDNQLMMLSSNSARTIFRGSVPSTQPVELYASEGPPAIASVRSPYGVYGDNFNLFWVNGASGTDEATGVLVKAPEMASATKKEEDVQILQHNMDLAYGVCGSPNSLYYTANGAVYGMKKSGGQSALLSQAASQARGCSWDGSGALWVCDEAGKVLQFPSDLLVPSAPHETVLEMIGPFDATLFIGGAESVSLFVAVFFALF